MYKKEVRISILGRVLLLWCLVWVKNIRVKVMVRWVKVSAEQILVLIWILLGIVVEILQVLVLVLLVRLLHLQVRLLRHLHREEELVFSRKCSNQAGGIPRLCTTVLQFSWIRNYSCRVCLKVLFNFKVRVRKVRILSCSELLVVSWCPTLCKNSLRCSMTLVR